jgi:hypothetical protein
MTDEERSQEGAGEDVEDLEAPASAQEDVAGGALCGARSCGSPSVICSGTCGTKTGTRCTDLSKRVVVFS